MIYVVVLILMLFCGIRAILTERLMVAALWLAGVSALLATLLYGMGAQVVAVIELSVGAGLVTVLFIFAISLAGDEPLPAPSVVPKPLAAALVIAFAALFILFTLPVTETTSAAPETSFVEIFWYARSADALAQIVLIFAGALTVLGLLTERRESAKRVFIPVQEQPIREEERL